MSIVWDLLSDATKSKIRTIMPPGWVPPGEGAVFTSLSWEEIDKLMRELPKDELAKVLAGKQI